MSRPLTFNQIRIVAVSLETATVASPFSATIVVSVDRAFGTRKITQIDARKLRTIVQNKNDRSKSALPWKRKNCPKIINILMRYLYVLFRIPFMQCRNYYYLHRRSITIFIMIIITCSDAFLLHAMSKCQMAKTLFYRRRRAVCREFESATVFTARQHSLLCRALYLL